MGVISSGPKTTVPQILRPYFDDLVDEDALPKFGHSFYKADFAIPSIGLLIEVKYATTRADFKKVEKEVMEDCVAYLQQTDRYDALLIFIYDESCSVQEHDETKRTLRRVAGVVDVVIVCKPSQLQLPKSPCIVHY